MSTLPRRRSLAALTAAVAMTAAPGVAGAAGNDLVLSRLAQPNAAQNDVIPDNQEFRSLVSELAVVISPKFLSPAETLGFSGFQLSAEIAYTTIDDNATYWQGRENEDGSGMIPTFAFFARKGLWLPVPSFELGAGALHVNDSRMWAAQAYGKLALHEGYQSWPLPSVGVRGSVSRLMGSEQIDLTIASFDASISKSFGVEGTMSIEPYAGWNYLWVFAQSEVIDKTPGVDALEDPQDIGLNFIFDEQDTITRQRIFGGIKVKYDVFALSAEVNVALAGNSVDERGAPRSCDSASASQKNDCNAEDKSTAQQSYAMSLSLDF